MSSDFSMNSSPLAPVSSDGTWNGFRLLAAGDLALLVATGPMWIPRTVFPQIPLVTLVNGLPDSFEWGLLAVLLVSLSVMLLPVPLMYHRWASLMTALGMCGLICFDQQRLQPWAWQFVLVALILAAADAVTARSAWRVLVIGIYAWSAWSKVDQGFCSQHGPFLWDGLCKSIGLSAGTNAWPANVRWSLAAAIPAAELLIAFGLYWQRTRSVAVIAASLMHVGLLLALGPFGHNHQPGVLIWNFFFLVQNWQLFHPRRTAATQPVQIPKQDATRIGNSFARFVVAAALCWPLLEPLGICDHWPAWEVYAARPERVTVYVAETDRANLPLNMQQYVETQSALDEGCILRLDRWSLAALHAPIYPQDRFQVGVALSIAREFKWNRIRIVIESPANRWTGQRTMRHYAGLESVEALANSYRCGAQPRTTQFRPY
jgi:hypothetical protein